ncbi:glycosyltransferase [Aeromonas rivipollensis]|uniref:glycosyltransferase n=1 Tax=Aeromonas rivipollensis TaxID=948519 RepID=UPI0038EBE965
MIVFIAPYLPPNRLGPTHLGASRKIELILSILSKIDNEIVLVNSSQSSNEGGGVKTQTSRIAGVDLIEILPPSLFSSSLINKVYNLFFIRKTLKAVSDLGKPNLILFYNGYAFEMLFSLISKSHFNAPHVFEFEDWHFSRERMLNPKPYIDYFFWRLAIKSMSAAFVVNVNLKKKISNFLSNIYVLPGIVSSDLMEISKNREPFSDLPMINVGYFGGLSKEKGADIVLELAKKLPSNFHIHTTGSGEYENDFLKERSNNFHYYGRVEDKFLYELISKCDVLINPHSSIEDMNNGIFPFKVIESLASGRLLISTDLPKEGLEDLLQSVVYVTHSSDDFKSAIMNSKSTYAENAEKIQNTALLASEKFSEATLKTIIENFLH